MQLNYDALLNAIADSFDKFSAYLPDDEYKNRKLKEFRDGLSVEEGRNYARIVKGGVLDRSAWGFIVLKEGKGFKVGDILKAESWKKPALNKARGNIIEGDLSKVSWTGPEYLR